ncbi:MAG TPA: hypothetical protein VFR78_12490 [Pyrinomonadaceae bacterium]|nr:hypothetical protein [Pyrinomonadaceae bacterium]
MDYKVLRSVESIGAVSFGIRIEVAAPAEFSEKLELLSYEITDQIEQQILRDFHTGNQDSQNRAAAEREQLLSLFPDPIYVEAIPNGYCPRACCEHLPWFVVTARAGRVKIGWRKRVIQIDWSECPQTATSKELFADDPTTKGERMIHAWGAEKAKEYVVAILRSVREPK